MSRQSCPNRIIQGTGIQTNGHDVGYITPFSCLQWYRRRCNGRKRMGWMIGGCSGLVVYHCRLPRVLVGRWIGSSSRWKRRRGGCSSLCIAIIILGCRCGSNRPWGGSSGGGHTKGKGRLTKQQTRTSSSSSSSTTTGQKSTTRRRWRRQEHGR